MDEIQMKQEMDSPRSTSSIAVWELRQAVEQCLIQKDVGRFCNVTVIEDGIRLILSGIVDSEWTHAEILAMIPDEERCVVDNLQIVPSPMLQRFAG